MATPPESGSEAVIQKPTGIAGMWGPAKDAVLHHWAPLLFIQIAAVALVLTYQHSPALRESLVAVEAIKVRGGLLFAFATGACAGGVIPEVAKLLTGRMKRMGRQWLLSAAYNAMVYGIVGIEVVLFYQAQTVWFGGGNHWTTLAIKTAVDMLVFSPVLTIPTAVLFYAWRSSGFRAPTGGLRAAYGFYMARIAPSLVLAWIFWIPVLLCVYSLPSNLQFPFSNLAEAAWSMVFVFFTTDGSG